MPLIYEGQKKHSVFYHIVVFLVLGAIGLMFAQFVLTVNVLKYIGEIKSIRSAGANAGLQLSLYKNSLTPLRLLENNRGNFILYVSNQNSDVNPVDIAVYVDDLLAVNQLFETGQGNFDEWIMFQFALIPGTHNLRVESSGGESSLAQEFEISEKHWALIGYWQNPNPLPHEKNEYFSFLIQSEPVLFE